MSDKKAKTIRPKAISLVHQLEEKASTEIEQFQQDYYNTFEQIRSITSKTKQAYVPILCKLVARGWPDKTLEWRQNKVMHDCMKTLGWEKLTVYTYIPSEFRPHPRKAAGPLVRKILTTEKANATKVLEALKYFDKIQEIPMKEPPAIHITPEHRKPEHGKTITEQRESITHYASGLFKSLTNMDHLPKDDEDVNDIYIEPSREFRRGLVLESDFETRTALCNLLYEVDAVTEDMLEVLNTESA